MSIPSHHDIAARAYALWQNSGSPAGRDFEFWLQAEAELAPRAETTRIEASAAAARPAAPARRAKRKSLA